MHGIDWAVLAAYLLGTSWLAERLSGRGQTIRDFFLGGRRLPWWAVSGSIVASEVSGVTFVAIPALSFAPGGNFTYLMLVTGVVLARFVIGYVFVPAFYRREIYSPYEFMGQRLGPAAERLATGLFFLGTFLAQGARLFVAALVLTHIAPVGIVGAIVLLGAVSTVWTWIGGIASVVWTDVVQFAVIFAGALAALAAVVGAVPGGIPEILRLGSRDGKFVLFDLRTDPAAAYTLWCGLLGMPFLTMASHGTDQMTAQRIFCCRDAAAARRAVLWSSLSQLLPVLMLTVGVGMYAYFRHFPPSAAEAALLAERSENVLPLFIKKAMPVGLRGLLFATVFSAATATSTLSAMAQTALASLYLPLRRRPAREAHLVLVSRLLVLVSAAGLCGAALACDRVRRYPAVLDLALAMAGYTYGALLGMLLLALRPAGRDARGLAWGVPFSVLLVFALSWQHQAWARAFLVPAAAVLGGTALWFLRREPARALGGAAAAALLLVVTFLGSGAGRGGEPAPLKLAWPWHFPLGTLGTYVLGWALGRKRLAGRDPASL